VSGRDILGVSREPNWLDQKRRYLFARGFILRLGDTAFGCHLAVNIS
jgi:hypothetical protein